MRSNKIDCVRDGRVRLGRRRTLLVGLLVAVMTSIGLVAPATGSAIMRKIKTTKIKAWSTVETKVAPGGAVTATFRVKTGTKFKKRAYDLQRRAPGGGWFTVSSGTTPRRGVESVSLRVGTTPGNWKFRIAVPAARNGTAAVSAVRKLRVPSTPPATASISIAHPKIDAGTGPVVSYATTRVPAGAKVQLQRQFGTDGVWRSVKTLSTGSGTVTAPALAQGAYLYRVVVASGSTIFATSAKRSVWVYAPMSLVTLCESDATTDCPSISSGSVVVGAHTFSYSGYFDAGTDWDDELVLAGSACRSLSLQFADYPTNDPTKTSVTLRLTQGTLDPQSTVAYSGTVATLNAVLDGGPAHLQSLRSGTWNWSTVYVNGSASCYSPDGAR